MRIFLAQRSVLVGIVMMALAVSVQSAQADLIQYQFNGAQTGNPSVTVQALLGIDSSFVVPNGSFTQANLSSFSVQFASPSFTASSTALPPSLSGQFNNEANVFSSLFVNDPLIIPGHTGTNNFQFYGLNGQAWSMAVTGPAPGPVQLTGSGTWQVAAVPVPAAMWLFGSGVTMLMGIARRTGTDTIGDHQ